MSLLREQPTMTVIELAETLEKSRSAILRAIKKLRDDGRLRHIGPAKGGRWEIRE
jgi:predicted HTH transcriptional regulator